MCVTHMNHKNDVLDPLTVVLKLFMLSYKPIGTKLSIGDHRVHIQEPGIFQGFVRALFRDSKNDINIIIFPLMYACVTYLSDATNRQRFRPIFLRALTSLDMLKETYQGNEIIFNLDQLKTILTTFLCSDDITASTLLSTYDSKNGKVKQVTYNHLNSIWTTGRLNIIFGIIDEILDPTVSTDICNGLLESLQLYTNSIDSMVHILLYS
jgi:hypothetical protein